MLPQDLIEVQGLRLFLEHFAQKDELIIAVSSADSEEAAAASESLAVFLRKQEGLAREVVSAPPLESSADQVSELLAYLLLNAPAERVSDALSNISPGQIETTLEETLETLSSGLDLQEGFFAGYDPFGLARTALGESSRLPGATEFSSADGTFRLIYVRTPDGSMGDYRQTIGWVTRIRSTISSWKNMREIPDSPVEVTLTGEPAFVSEISSSMRKDMQLSGAFTLTIIGIVFFLFYQRIRPLLGLVCMLGITFFITLALSGFILRGLTVISVGFASVLIGLCVDYGFLLYQRALSKTTTAGTLRKEALPGIAWAAFTTAAAFLAMATSQFPGLAEMGILVSVGIVVGALVMLGLYSPISAVLTRGTTNASPRLPLWENTGGSRGAAFATVALVILLGVGVPVGGLPKLETSSGSLRPHNSEAYGTLDRLYEELSQNAGSINLIVRGTSTEDVRQRLETLSSELAAPPFSDSVTDTLIPLPLWPSPQNQSANRVRLAALQREVERLAAGVDSAGFSPDSMTLTREMIRHWSRWENTPFPVWPESETAHRILRRTAAVTTDQSGHFALAVITPAPDTPLREIDHAALALEARGDIFPVNWDLLDRRLTSIIKRDMTKTLTFLTVGVLVIVTIAFRSVWETVLTIFVVLLNLVALLGTMAWLEISWNFINLGALLLSLGAGLDYSIHILLSLKEERGDIRATHRSTGFALLVCALSTVAGFGSLSFASTRGLASLGTVCALALAINAAISLFLLPWLWKMRRNH